jgi:hypothetical protein
LCAAVADYRPSAVADKKIKRTSDGMTIELEANPDIAASLGKIKRDDQRMVGFALETNDGENNAREKLAKKNLDFIVLNSLTDKGAGFAVDTNKITIIDKEGETRYPLKSKSEVARDIIKHLSKLLLLLLFLLLPSSVAAQELNAVVTLNSSKIQGTNTEVFESLQDALSEFINNRKWTSYSYEDYERVSCNFTFIVDEYTDAGDFETTLMVQSTRPIYGSSYNSPLFMYEDKVRFNYQSHDRLEFNEDNLDNNLTAVVAFYAYLIIGLDMESMGEMGGSEFLNKAQNIANNAQNLADTGWRAGSGNNNRFAIIDDYMNGALEPLRRLMYRYHRLGLDTMYKNADEGRKIITETMELLNEAYNNRPLAYFTKLFTEYKQDELVNIYFRKGTAEENKGVVKILSDINPSLSASWDKILKGR